MAFRTTLRALARTPGFTAVTVLALGLGIGAATAMFSIVNTVLFRPLRFQDPDRLYITTTRMTNPQTSDTREFAINPKHFSDWRSGCVACDSVALAGAQGFTLSGSGTPVRLPGIETSFNFFRTLGVAPVLGRDFLPEDEGPRGFHVVLLSDTAWRTHFGADASIVGRSIVLNGEPHTVVGVMPAWLTLPRGTQWGPFFPINVAPLVFRPVSIDVAARRPWGAFNYAAVVRMKPTVAPDRAAHEMTAAIEAYARDEKVSATVLLTPIAERVTGTARSSLLLLGAAMTAVLVLIALNVGGLLLVRSVGRSREAGIMLALGAGAADLFRPVVAEVLGLCAAGAALGAGIAFGAIRMFAANAPLTIPRVEEIRPDWTLLAFVSATTIATGVIATLAPLWRLMRVELRQPLLFASRSATETRSRLRTLDIMMAAEVALTTAVLLVGGLLAASFINVMRMDRGFRTEQTIVQQLPLTSPKYQGPAPKNTAIARALAAFRAIPGVSAAGITSQLPLRGETWVDTLFDFDHRVPEEQAPLANRRFISPDYLNAMGVMIVEGRDFAESDRSRPVAIISEKAAKLLWPSTSALGRRVVRVQLGANPPPEPADIVGIVGDVRTTATLEDEPPPIVYEPYWQVGPGGPAFVFRTTRDAASIAPDIRAAVAAIDPDLPVAPPQAMETIVSEVASVRRFQVQLVMAFATAAVAVAALGLYGLVSFSVARRTRELGLRVALGATSGSILALVIRRGLRPVAIGAALGLAAALLGGDLIASQLYGVSAQDPLIMAAVVAVLGLVATLACCVPAWRATRVDPMIPLRTE